MSAAVAAHARDLNDFCLFSFFSERKKKSYGERSTSKLVSLEFGQKNRFRNPWRRNKVRRRSVRRSAIWSEDQVKIAPRLVEGTKTKNGQQPGATARARAAHPIPTTPYHIERERSGNRRVEAERYGGHRSSTQQAAWGRGGEEPDWRRGREGGRRCGNAPGSAAAAASKLNLRRRRRGKKP